LRHVALALVALLGPAGARGADPGGRAARLRDHRGRIVVLNFWAAWCGPCKKELPLLAGLQRDYEARGVLFLGASTDAPERREEAAALLAKTGVDYPIVFGLAESDMRSLGLGALLPATAVFDRDGTRAFRLVGEVTRERLVQRLEWLLGGRAGPQPKELLLPPGIDAADYRD
jgi:thiol-disulfide isomerase/thioredoxin